MQNPPSYRQMYLSFEPGSQLVTTKVLLNGQLLKTVEIYRLAGGTLIINRPAANGEPGYIINANYNVSGDQITISSPDFSVTATRVYQVPGEPPAQTGRTPF